MIKFFRHIRQRMIKENPSSAEATAGKRVSKYLLYAIGEIVLVVIGILIAVSINTWNGERKERNYERVLLEKIQEDLRLDTIDLGYNLRFHEQTSIAESALLALLMSETDLIKEPDYNVVLGIEIILITHRSAYQNLIGHDISILKDEKLKSKLARQYDFFYPAMEAIENESPAFDIYSRKFPFFMKHFKLANYSANTVLDGLSTDKEREDYLDTDLVKRKIEPIDLALMKQDEAFKILLSECIFQHGAAIAFYNNVLERTRSLDKEIGEYLNKK